MINDGHVRNAFWPRIIPIGADCGYQRGGRPIGGMLERNTLASLWPVVVMLGDADHTGTTLVTACIQAKVLLYACPDADHVFMGRLLLESHSWPAR